MQLRNKATLVDFFPVGTGKRFVKRTVWHPGDADSEMTVFDTVPRIDALYFMNSMIANGAEITGINTEEYTGSDYSPCYC